MSTPTTGESPTGTGAVASSQTTMKPDPYAQPNCRICHGVGRVKTGPRVTNWSMCTCVIAGHRMAAAEQRIRRLFPARQRQMTLGCYDTGGIAQNEMALKVARNFVDFFPDACDNGWLLGFWGPPASGKTHLAVGLAQACIKRYGAYAEIINLPRMLFDVRERWSRPRGQAGESPLMRAMNTQLLILDDFGAHYDANANQDQVSWVSEQIYLVLDERIMMNRPVIYTMNLRPSQLKAQLDNESGMRVLSRLERAEVPGSPVEVRPVPGASGQSPDAAAKLFG